MFLPTNNITKIYFGSHDSIDIDVAYVLESLPSLNDCKKLCANKENENSNIIVIKDGIVVNSYKGTSDEMNNVIFNTFKNHKQILEVNPIQKEVERDVMIKIIRTMRGIFSQISRTIYRVEVKAALKSFSFKERIEALDKIDLTKILSFEKTTNTEAYKFLAFQLGQTLALVEGKEFYTKMDVALYYPLLKPFLYREEKVNVMILNNFLKKFISTLKDINYEQKNELVCFKNKCINIKEEKYINIIENKKDNVSKNTFKKT